jgi:medium-chain acyl-[acyl-carrier-protein] hydrolase
MPYSMNDRIRFSESDSSGRLSIPGLINLFQDCCTFQSEDLGVGKSYMKSRHEAWFIFSWQIKIDSLPALGDQVTADTWAAGFNALIAKRDFRLKSADGEKVFARARSIWSIVDLDQMFPKKIDPKQVEAYGMEPPVEGTWYGRKIRYDETRLSEKRTFTVSFDQLDSNHHMNNSQYVLEAMSEVPEGATVNEIRVEYKMQALLGEEIHIFSSNESGKAVISMKKTDGTECAVVQFGLE